MANLVALGDSNAGEDSGACKTAEAACAVASVTSHRDQTAVITLNRLPDGSWDFVGTQCVAVGPPQVTAAMVRARVVRLIPGAALGLAPHDATLVNIQTIMWVDAPARRTLVPVIILGQRVVIRLRIDHVAWTFGDTASTVTDGPGKPYDKTGDPCRSAQCPDYFGHTYRQAGRDTVTATASWVASFTVNGGAPVAIPGTVAGPTASTPVAVKQARTVLVPTPNGH